MDRRKLPVATSPALERAGQQDSHLLSLPPESRLNIYRYVLTCPKFLRSPSELRRYQTSNRNQTQRRIRAGESERAMTFDKPKSIKIFQDNALLRTCQLIHEEAVPFFYANCKFHFSIPIRSSTSFGPFDLKLYRPLSLNLNFVRHISLDFAHTWPSCFTSFTRQTATEVDLTIAAYVSLIKDGCPSLRTFTLHILADTCFMSVVQEALHHELSCTAMVLATLKPRDQLNIVARADRDCIVPSRQGLGSSIIRQIIAPGTKWSMFLQRIAWPKITMSKWQYRTRTTANRRLPTTMMVEWRYIPPGAHPCHKYPGRLQ